MNERRIRPDPNYAPVTTKRPKALKPLKPCKDRIDVNAMHKQPQSTRNNMDLKLDIRPERRNTYDYSPETIMEARAEDELDKIGLWSKPKLDRDDSMFRDTGRLKEYVDTNVVTAMRRSHERGNDMNRTHHE